MRGSDHACSLEEKELKELMRKSNINYSKVQEVIRVIDDLIETVKP